jgi:hypothetical protein
MSPKDLMVPDRTSQARRGNGNKKQKWHKNVCTEEMTKAKV